MCSCVCVVWQKNDHDDADIVKKTFFSSFGWYSIVTIQMWCDDDDDDDDAVTKKNEISQEVRESFCVCSISCGIDDDDDDGDDAKGKKIEEEDRNEGRRRRRRK